MLSLINVGTNDVSVPNIVVGPALFYGGKCSRVDSDVG